MSTEQQLLRQILDELKRISGDLSVLTGDVNAIRNGEYDKPKGADYGMRPVKPAGEPRSDPRW